MKILNIKNNKKRGGISLIGILILGFILILVLSYFRISIRSVVESPEAQDNINYVSSQSRNVWDDYLKKPANYVWEKVFKDLLWASFVNNMERIRDGQPTEMEESAPSLNINNIKTN
ncbi:MAG: hypothetical protein ABH951_01690 [Patescibacteria group bacterium]